MGRVWSSLSRRESMDAQAWRVSTTSMENTRPGGGPEAWATAAIVAATVMWAILPIALKPAALKVDSHVLVFVRFLVAGMVLLPVVWLSGAWRRAGVWSKLVELKWYLLALAVFGFAVPQLCFTWAISKRPAGLVALVVYAYPCLSVVMATVFLRERFRWFLAGPVALLVGGLYLIHGTEGPFGEGPLESAAVFAAPIVVSLGWAASTVLTKHVLNRGVPAIITALVRIVLGVAAIAPFLLLSGGLAEQPWDGLGGLEWLGLVYTALVPVAVGLPVYLYGLRRLPVVKASLVESWTPVLTAILAIPLLGETLMPLQWLGGAMVVLASVMASVMSGRRMQPGGSDLIEKGGEGAG